jgi:hypothetical protein
MGKVFKYALVAGAAGAAVGAVQSFRRDDDGEQIAQKAMKGAAEGVAIGATLGLFVNRRNKKKLAKQRAKVATGLTAAGLLEAAKAAKPVIEHAVEYVTQAAETARPHVEHALVDVALPKVEYAAKVARERATEAAVAARPHVEHAATVAKERATEAAVAARPAVEQARERVLARVA